MPAKNVAKIWSGQKIAFFFRALRGYAVPKKMSFFAVVENVLRGEDMKWFGSEFFFFIALIEIAQRLGHIIT